MRPTISSSETSAIRTSVARWSTAGLMKSISWRPTWASTGFIFVGENDADIMHNSGTINLNMLDVCCTRLVPRIFYSSSACIYPAYNQLNPNSPNCEESSAYPAAPDSEYGWEKLFSERLYLAYSRCRGIEVRIARYHNIFGPEGTWTGGREKAPAALAARWPRPRTEGRSIFGAMATEPDHSCMCRSASRVRSG